MGRPAAFFDLDRTLLRKASGPVLGEALRGAGLMGKRPIPGQGILYWINDVYGELAPSMLLARQGPRAARGWDRRRVQAAAEAAVPELVSLVPPYAWPLLDEHRAAGRPLVLATTSPVDLVRPFAEALGVDALVGTRYGVTADGRYDGTLDGPFVWGPGKLEAVRTWADEHGIDVEASWAYSDSVYDVPLLSAVAHPVAVNPDPRLLAVATARRWPTLHLDVPPGVPKLLGVEPQRALQVFARPELVPYARFDITGVERIPAEGPAIVCGNHRSYFDPTAMGILAAKRGRVVRALGKKEVFDAPVVGPLARMLGGIRVERATGSDEPLKEAAAALEAGELVMIMPQGTIPRGRAFFDPELRGRWGAARLAAMTKAPVVPVGLWGTEKVWPRSARLPNVLNVANPPLVTVRVGPPVELHYDDPDADTRRILDAIVALLPPIARVRRDPTPDELARTVPPGHAADLMADDEAARRPGRD